MKNFRAIWVIFQVGFNIRPVKQEGGWIHGEGGENRPFGVSVATWCSYKVPGEVHRAMAAVPGHSCPIGALQQSFYYQIYSTYVSILCLWID